MNVAEAAFIVQELGATEIRIRHDKVLCSCVVHQDSNPSAAVLLHRFRGATFHCSSCGHNESLLALIWRKIQQNKRPYTRALAAYWDSVEADAANGSPTRLDYKPMADRAPLRDDAPALDRPTIPWLRGTQLDLKAISTEAPEKRVFTEDDLNRYQAVHPQYMLKERAFDQETLTTWEIRDAPRIHRAVFPIRNWSGGIYGVTRRLYWTRDYCFKCKANIRKPDGEMVYACKGCGQKLAKYLHSSGMHRNEILYGEWLYKDGAIPVLVEGTTDAMRLWQHGVRPPLAMPMALLGACPGFDQTERLFSKTDQPVVVVRDNDPPTEQHPNGPGAQTFEHLTRHAKALGDNRRIIEITPWSKDAGDMGKAEVDVLLNALEIIALGGEKSGRATLDPAGIKWYTAVANPHGAGYLEMVP